MLAIAICVVVATICFLAGRRSLVAGIGCTLAVGYVYGIARANLQQTGAHFLFDAAVAGLFLARLTVRSTDEAPDLPPALKWWVAILIAWPFLLLAIPRQDPLVQLVGFRGNAFLLPFLLLGAQLSDDRKYRLALWCAVLNVLVFFVAAAEFSFGIEAFFPRSEVTRIIYMSNDVGEKLAYRIPGTFGNAHAFGGTMVTTLPLLLGAWLQDDRPRTHKVLLTLAVLAAAVGVFMSAARSHALLLFVFLAFATVVARMTLLMRASWIGLLTLVLVVVSLDPRLQRFTNVSSVSTVTERIGWGMNSSLVEKAIRYPMGNGLGGGGTSMPFFLQNRLQNPVLIENEYARIMLEQGIPGLLLWLTFLAWLLTRPSQESNRAWRNGRAMTLCVVTVSFATGMIGTGLLTSVPQTAILLLGCGWLAGGRRTLGAMSADARSQTRAMALSGVTR